MLPASSHAQGVLLSPACCRARTNRALPPLSPTRRQTWIIGTARQRRRGEHIHTVSNLSWLRARRRSQQAPPSSIPLRSMPIATAAPLRETVSLDLLVPVADNDGVPFSEADFEAFERRVVALTGGITRRADVEDIWLNPFGEYQRERSRSYTTTVPSRDAVAVMTELDALIRSSFDQFNSYIQAVPTLATVF